MIGAVILGAGESSRMGTQKLLLEINGKQMIERVIESFSGIADEIVVVLGHKPELLIPTLEKLDVKWVVNENYPEGMVTSFQEGLKKFKDFDAVFMVLGDQPIVKRDFLNGAIEAWREGAKIVCPIFNGKKGHPVLFDHSLLDEILALGKGQFVRDVIHRHKDGLRVIDASDWAITDLDTPESLETFKRKF